MNLRVAPWFYRLLWITVALLGALCTLGFLPVLLGASGVTDNSDKVVFLAGGVFGLIVLGYAIRRLLWPLKAPPRP